MTTRLHRTPQGQSKVKGAGLNYGENREEERATARTPRLRRALLRGLQKAIEGADARSVVASNDSEWWDEARRDLR
jgi:hypothetical protein